MFYKTCKSELLVITSLVTCAKEKWRARARVCVCVSVIMTFSIKTCSTRCGSLPSRSCRLVTAILFPTRTVVAPLPSAPVSWYVYIRTPVSPTVCLSVFVSVCFFAVVYADHSSGPGSAVGSCLCHSVCLCFQTIAFEGNDFLPNILICWFVFTLSSKFVGWGHRSKFKVASKQKFIFRLQVKVKLGKPGTMTQCGLADHPWLQNRPELETVNKYLKWSAEPRVRTNWSCSGLAAVLVGFLVFPAYCSECCLPE